MKTENIQSTFKIAGNLSDVYRLAKSNHKVNDPKTPEKIMQPLIRECIETRRKIVSNDEALYYQLQDVSEYLFTGTDLKTGSERYLQMFRDLSKLPGASKYKKEIAKFKKWIKYTSKSNYLLEMEVDENLINRTGNNPAVIERMIKKYETICVL